MKKLTALILTLCISLALFSCGVKNADNPSAVNNTENAPFKKDKNLSYDRNDNIILCSETPYYGFCDYAERLALSASGGQVSGLNEQFTRKKEQIKKIISSYHSAKGDFVYADFESGAALVSYTGKKSEVKIPKEIDGKRVIALCGRIEISREDTGTVYLYRNPFTDKNVKSVTLPETVKYISKTALYTSADARGKNKKPTLEKISVAKANPFYTSRDGMLLNKDMTALLCVPDNRRDENVTVPDGVKTVYSVLSNNTRRVALSKTVEKIELLSAFDFLERSRSDWALNVYGGKNNLESIEVDKDSKTFCSENGVLYNKDKTELIAYPYSKPDEVFIVPRSVLTVGEIDSAKLKNARKISFGKAIREINMYCEKNADITLQKIQGCKGTAAEEYAEKYDLEFQPDSILGKAETLNIKTKGEVSNKWDYIEYPENVVLGEEATKIADYGFMFSCEGNSGKRQNNNDRIKTFKMPNTVKSIGESAFWDCEGLERIELSENIEEIGANAFNSCEILTKIKLPDALKTLGFGSFSDCVNLREVSFGEKLERIEADAFSGCGGLTRITLPASLEKIGGSAFSDCYSLRELTIQGNTSSIGSYAFYGCKSLAQVSLSPKLETIKSAAFASCRKLKTVLIPKSVTKIGGKAFGYYTNENCDFIKEKNFTIKGCKGTAAEEYAKKNGFKFIAVE